MRRLEGRIRKIENKLMVNNKSKELLIAIFKHYDTLDLPEPPPGVEDKAAWKAKWQRECLESLGPHKEWLTVKAQKEAARKAHREKMKGLPPDAPNINVITIALNPKAELEARKRQKATKDNISGENEADE